MVRTLLLTAVVATLAQDSPPVIGLENAPIVFTAPAPWDTITATVVALDSLRVVVGWTHPNDGGGNEDSTFFRIKATRTIRFMGGGTVAPDTWRRRMGRTATQADTFKILRPAIGDSVIFTADSISQCRLNQCSAPGSASWGYKRTAAPPSMTFIRVTTDSF
jgi:hypothetical protein